MPQALSASPRDLPRCLNGLVDRMHRLRVEYGVEIQYDTLPHDVGTYNAATNTITIDHDAPIDDQTKFLTEIWNLVTSGPGSVRWGRRTPHLHLVPPSALDTA